MRFNHLSSKCFLFFFFWKKKSKNFPLQTFRHRCTVCRIIYGILRISTNIGSVFQLMRWYIFKFVCDTYYPHYVLFRAWVCAFAKVFMSWKCDFDSISSFSSSYFAQFTEKKKWIIMSPNKSVAFFHFVKIFFSIHAHNVSDTHMMNVNVYLFWHFHSSHIHTHMMMMMTAEWYEFR